MGADGHIDIFDYEKIEKHFGIEKIYDLLAETINTYVREIFGHKIITGYFGDNLVDSWCADIDRGDNEEDQKMIEWMENNAKIDTWEVWT